MSDRRRDLRQYQADLLLLSVTLIWGSTFVIVKNAVSLTPPFTFLFVRFSIASLFLFLWHAVASGLARKSWSEEPLIREERQTRQVRTVVRGIVAGFALYFAYATQTIGLLSVDAGKAAFITGFSVVLVPALSPFVFNVRTDLITWLGVALATVGLFLMSFRLPFSVGKGDLWLMTCALGFAAHIILVGMFSADIDPVLFTAVQLGTVALGSLLGAGMLERPLRVQPGTVPAIVFTGIFATSLAFLIQAWAQRHTSASHTAVIFSAEPVFGAVFAWLLAGEVLSLRETVGAACILGGIVMTEVVPLLRAERGYLVTGEAEDGKAGGRR